MDKNLIFLCGSSTQTRSALLPLLCTDRLTRSEEAELGAALLYENNTTGSTLTEIAQWIFPRSSEQLDCHIIIFYSISVFKLSTGSILRRVAVPCVISTLGLFNQPLLSASLSCYWCTVEGGIAALPVYLALRLTRRIFTDEQSVGEKPSSTESLRNSSTNWVHNLYSESNN